MRIKNKEKTNQYINETELKSLMIRINNKSFIQHLSNSFLRLNKYIIKYNSATNKHLKLILEQAIIKSCNLIIKNKYKQLILMTDDDIVDLKKSIIDYNAIYNDITLQADEWETKRYNSYKNIINLFEPYMAELNTKNDNLKSSKKTDLIRIDKYIKKHTKSKSQKLKKILREHIILISERNIIDKESYERFGEMVLLIIKNILKKPFKFEEDFNLLN